MQFKQRLLPSLAAVSAAALLAACAQPGTPVGGNYPGTYPTTSYPAGQQYSQFGRVTNVEYVRGGSGRTAATVAGVVGGALIGRALEQNMNRNTVDHYRVPPLSNCTVTR